MQWRDRRVWLVLLVPVGASLAMFLPWRGGSDQLVETFDTVGVLEETGSMEESRNADWWLNSGGRLHFRDGVGATLAGELAMGDRWRRAYAEGDPLDTDSGARPQNLLRLITRGRWRDARQSLRFRIKQITPTLSPNRNKTNGVLLIHRFQDGDDLYYAGLRVDGAAVVKKKAGGVYFTLAYRQLYPGEYDRQQNPSLLPLDRWLALETTIENEPGGGVRLAIRAQDPAAAGDHLVEVLAVVDHGAESPQIVAEGHAGVRTDFAEVELDDYRIEPIERK